MNATRPADFPDMQCSKVKDKTRITVQALARQGRRTSDILNLDVLLRGRYMVKI